MNMQLIEQTEMTQVTNFYLKLNPIVATLKMTINPRVNQKVHYVTRQICHLIEFVA